MEVIPPTKQFCMTSTSYNSYIIRNASPDDAENLALLSRQLLDYEKSLNQAMGELTDWAASANELRKQLRRPNNRFFVAEKNDAIAGYLKLTIYGLRPERKEIGTVRWLADRMERLLRSVFNFLLRRPRANVEAVGGYIAGAFVHPDDRRKKIGQSLVAAAESWLQAQGINSAELHVLYVNEDARRFWEKAGYEPLTLGMRKKL